MCALEISVANFVYHSQIAYLSKIGSFSTFLYLFIYGGTNWMKVVGNPAQNWLFSERNRASSETSLGSFGLRPLFVLLFTITEESSES